MFFLQLGDTVSTSTVSSQSSHDATSPARQKRVIAKEVGVAKEAPVAVEEDVVQEEGVVQEVAVAQEEHGAALPISLQEDRPGASHESSENTSSSETDSDSSSEASGDDDQFFDAELPSENEGLVVTSPSVSIPPAEGEPSDIEGDDKDYDERDDASSEQGGTPVMCSLWSLPNNILIVVGLHFSLLNELPSFS